MADTNKQRNKYREQGLEQFLRWVKPEEGEELDKLYRRQVKRREKESKKY